MSIFLFLLGLLCLKVSCPRACGTVLHTHFYKLGTEPSRAAQLRHPLTVFLTYLSNRWVRICISPTKEFFGCPCNYCFVGFFVLSHAGSRAKQATRLLLSTRKPQFGLPSVYRASGTRQVCPSPFFGAAMEKYAAICSDEGTCAQCSHGRFCNRGIHLLIHITPLFS